MPVMNSTRTLRKTAGGETTNIMAKRGQRVRVLDDDTLPWTQIELTDVADKPQGWVSDVAIDKTRDSLPSIDRDMFAKACCIQADRFGLKAHFLMSFAELRTKVTDGPSADGVDVGPFAFSAPEWRIAANRPEFGVVLDDAQRDIWDAQCLVFAIMTLLGQKKLATLIGDQPTVTELCLAQMVGTKAAIAVLRNKTLPMTDIVAGISNSDVESEAIEVGRIAVRHARYITGLTAEKAIENLTADMQSALDVTRQFIQSAGGAFIETAKELLGAGGNVDPKINLDSPSIPAGRKDIAKLIVTRFAEASFGVLQQIAALANAIAESGLDPQAASTPPERSFGLFQLNQAGVGAGFSEAVLKDKDRNIEITLAEISKPHQSDAKKRFAETTSLHEAVSIFVRSFERPANPDSAIAKRFAIAEKILT